MCRVDYYSGVHEQSVLGSGKGLCNRGVLAHRQMHPIIAILSVCLSVTLAIHA